MHSVYVALLDDILVASSVVAVAAHFSSLSAMVFTAMEHLASSSGIVATAFEIGGAAFESASTVGSSAVS
jgi:hypothetical protein